MTKIFSENASRLNRLNLTNCSLTSKTIGKLFFALKNNNFMTDLILDHNDLSNYKFDQISIFLWSNKKLQRLQLSHCKITSEGVNAIGEGLLKNTALSYLDLSHNKFLPKSLKRWSDTLGKSGLKHLDMSFNDIEDQGVMYLIEGL